MNPRDQTREAFARLVAMPTRWLDNDIYGHVNNVQYYSYFDTAVNQWLIEHGALDIHDGAAVGFVVETGCTYFRPVSFPDLVQVGIRVVRIGTSSVRYELGLFRNDDPAIAAAGHFVHVYVDRASGQPTPVPAATRELLQGLMMPAAKASP